MSDPAHNPTDCLETLIATSKSIVIAVAKQYLAPGRAEDIDDVVQEVYLKIFILSKKGKLNHITQIESFLYIMTKNQCLTWNRKNGRTSPLEQTHDAISAPTPSLDLDSREALYGAISTMPHCYRTLIQRILDGYTLSELSAQLSISINTLKSQYHRAKKCLLVHLSQKEAPLHDIKPTT